MFRYKNFRYKNFVLFRLYLTYIKAEFGKIYPLVAHQKIYHHKDRGNLLPIYFFQYYYIIVAVNHANKIHYQVKVKKN